MRSLHLWFVGFNLALVGGGLWYWMRPSLVPRTSPLEWAQETLRPPAEQADPVIVILVEHPQALAALRRALPADDIRAANHAAFAVGSGRVFASDLEAASGPINALGWSSRPLEIVSRQLAAGGRAPGPERADGSSTAGGSGSPLSLAELAKKKTLTRMEAMALLEQLH